MDFDLFVIGGGSGGVRCARIAASHGARVGIAESRFWGGTCVNVGCVPKKILVQASEYGVLAEDSRGFGWDAPHPTHDWATLIARKDREIARLNGIYTSLLESAGAAHFDAHATLIDAHTIELISAGERARRVTAGQIVIATGGQPNRPAIPGAELGIVSDDAFHLPTLPSRVVIIGGGYIAVEFAGIFHGLGAEVALAFRQALPLRGFDEDMRAGLDEAMAASGIALHRHRHPVAVEAAGDARSVVLDDGTVLAADLVLFATGRMPNTARLGLDAAGVLSDAEGRIVVDDNYRTNVAHIYAIGDVANRLNLTPVAIAEGHNLADRLFGAPPPRGWSFQAVPTAVFSQPPLATAGLTEGEAARRGPADIYLARFTSMRNTISGRARKTIMKLVVEQASQRVIGAHILGEDAPEMMQGIAVAMTAGATKADFDRTVGIHPTAAEEFVTLRTRTHEVGVAKAAE